ncbi:hypothetical protein SEA_SPEEDDEMON_1280 [Gordonia phage SpeedDemon]|nr:hypothetical protein SEA_SPEEDDEMON_1280 [Gordonia phage SpeedDemon]
MTDSSSTIYVATTMGGQVAFNATDRWAGPRCYAYNTTGPARAIANKVDGKVLAVTIHDDGVVTTEWLPAKRDR